MARSSRRELEKDNPTAPQPRRRRRTQPTAHTDASGPATADEVLETLTEAAERFVDCTPRLKKLDGERQALLDAITRAQLVLSVHRFQPGTVGDTSANDLAGC